MNRSQENEPSEEETFRPSQSSRLTLTIRQRGGTVAEPKQDMKASLEEIADNLKKQSEDAQWIESLPSLSVEEQVSI